VLSWAQLLIRVIKHHCKGCRTASLASTANPQWPCWGGSFTHLQHSAQSTEEASKITSMKRYSWFKTIFVGLNIIFDLSQNPLCKRTQSKKHHFGLIEIYFVPLSKYTTSVVGLSRQCWVNVWFCSWSVCEEVYPDLLCFWCCGVYSQLLTVREMYPIMYLICPLALNLTGVLTGVRPTQ
jgi:hypothetical protein